MPTSDASLRIEQLVHVNRNLLDQCWISGAASADLMFTVVRAATDEFIQQSYTKLEQVAKRLMLFLKRTRDRQAMGRLLPAIRAYRKGKRDQRELQRLLHSEIEGILLEDAIRIGLERGVFRDLGDSVNLTPNESFETLYPKTQTIESVQI